MTEFGSYPDRETMEESWAETGRFNDQLQADGHFVFANGLANASTATVVDGQGEIPLFTDGPYLEAKEYIAGFWIIEAEDLDQALSIAAGASKACRGKVEVRPFASL
ncbi:YciI family protein [Nakamurella alba]